MSDLPSRNNVAAVIAARRLRGCDHNEVISACARCITDALLPLLARVWDGGADAAWEESGEGWNGEYPDDATPRWRLTNPYRAALAESTGEDA